MAINVTTYGSAGSNGDIFELFNNNTIGTAYKKNGNCRMGYYNRNNSYVLEVLSEVDISGIPAGATINSVNISVTIAGRSLPTSPGTTSFFLARGNKGAWTDNGSTEPVYDTFAASSWSDIQRTISDANTTTVPASGEWDWGTTTNYKDLWQDYVDGVVNNRGIVFGGNTSTVVYNVSISKVTITVDYTEGGASLPTVTTGTLSSLTRTTVNVNNSDVTDDGGAAVTARGVCWDTTTLPDINDSKTTDGTGTGVFTSNVSSLLPGRTYYLRAYATNSEGTSYGSTQRLFRTRRRIIITTS